MQSFVVFLALGAENLRICQQIDFNFCEGYFQFGRNQDGTNWQPKYKLILSPKYILIKLSLIAW